MNDASARLQQAVRLHETGLAIQRQNLRRRHPDASEEEIVVLLAAWLADRPMDYSST